jgi:acyl homoserine lactone synthase
MMIRISQGYSLTDARDAAMFDDRRRLFVDLMRWDVPVTDGRFEIDQFDGDHAIYVADFDEHGEHRGSMRLLPSTRPHILADLFAELCDQAPPRGNGIFEITRLCLPARLGAKERLVVRNRLISAMVDYALAMGIRTLTGVVRPAFRKTVRAMGWQASALGSARIIGGTRLAAFRIEIDPDTPADLARTGIYVPATLSTAIAA